MTTNDISILPTPESREQFLLTAHERAKAYVERLRDGGFDVTPLSPYDGPTLTSIDHYLYGSILKIYTNSDSVQGPVARVSVATFGGLIGTPMAWSLLTNPTIGAQVVEHQPLVEKIEAMERATVLLQRIGQFVVYERARQFWGPNFRPSVTALSDVVHGETKMIEISNDLRDVLDEYEALVRATGFPSVLLPETERDRSARPDPRANDKPLAIPAKQLRMHVLQALRSVEGELVDLAESIKRGEQLPDMLAKRERGKELATLTKRAFGYNYFASSTAEDLLRVKVVLDELEAECAVVTTCFGAFYRLREDPEPEAVRQLGRTKVNVSWLLGLPEDRALRYLREWCGLSRSRSAETLAELRYCC
jgi:hypothetical protein